MHSRTRALIFLVVMSGCGTDKDTTTEGTTGDTATASTSSTSSATSGETEPTGGATTGGETTGGVQLPPSDGLTCFPECVGDQAPETPVVEATCEVYENIPGMEAMPIPLCTEVDGQWEAPTKATVCYAMLVDKDGKQTPSMLDDMSASCVDAGSNLELQLVRSADAPADTTVTAHCEPSDNQQRDCPNL